MNKVITITAESEAIQHLCKKDKSLAKVISAVGEITYTLHDDPFDFLVHEIIEQMLSVKAGQVIYSRLLLLCGEITPKSILQQKPSALRATGMSNAKAQYIQILAESVIQNKLCLNNLSTLPSELVIKTLTQIRGIGIWTAKMYLIFILNKQDVLPFEDGAFIQSYRWLYKTDDITPNAVRARCKKWKPYSSLAARYLYRALDMGLTKEEFHLFK